MTLQHLRPGFWVFDDVGRYVADQADAARGLGKRGRAERKAHLLGGFDHEGAVESAAHIEGKAPLRACRLQSLGCLRDGFGVARDDGLPRAVSVRHHDDVARPAAVAADFVHGVVVETQHGCHSARSFLASLSHEVASESDQARALFDAQKARARERAVLTDAMTCQNGRRRLGFICERHERGNSDRVESDLGVLSLAERFLVGLETEGRDVPFDGIAHALEHRARDFAGVIDLFAHTWLLRPLTRKDRCVRAATHRSDSTRSGRVPQSTPMLELPRIESVLEFERVIEDVSARCASLFGVERLRETRPSFDAETVAGRLQETEEARLIVSLGDLPAIGAARDVRSHVLDAAKGGQIGGEEMFRVGESLAALSRLRAFLLHHRERAPLLWAKGEQLPYLDSLEKQIFKTVAPDGTVLDSASPELARLRSQRRTHQNRLIAKLQSLISGPFRSALQEPLYTQRGGRYVLPVKAGHQGQVKGIVHDASASGQTVYIEPEAVIAESNKLREIEAYETEEIDRILSELSRKVGEHGEEIAAGLESLGDIDAALAKARYAIDRNAATPTITGKGRLAVRQGHHPLIPMEVSVPLDIEVGGRARSLLITGPNTGGKTVALKLLGLYALMMGCGMFPPASHVEYGPFSGVYADIGDEQSLQQSLSTFSSHLRNIAQVFRDARESALVLLDEIGAGTDPREGAALGRAILEDLAERGCVIAATTHFGELKDFAFESGRFSCAAMEFDEKTLAPTFRLVAGASGASHALEIARRFGLPAKTVDSAERYVGSEVREERSKAKSIDANLAAAREEREEAERQRQEAEQIKKRAEEELIALREKVQKERREQAAAIEAALRESREQYRELLDRVRALEATGTIGSTEREEVIQSGRRLLEKAEQSRSLAADVVPVGESVALDVGMTMRIVSTGQVGTVVRVAKSGKITVQVGMFKVTADRQDLVPVAAPTPTRTERPQRASSLSLQKSLQASTEINLRRLRAEDAELELEKFFDDAVLANLHSVRIVHGKGTGTLKRIVLDFLRRRADVESYREGGAGEGGAGVTIAYLKP